MEEEEEDEEGETDVFRAPHVHNSGWLALLRRVDKNDVKSRCPG